MLLRLSAHVMGSLWCRLYFLLSGNIPHLTRPLQGLAKTTGLWAVVQRHHSQLEERKENSMPLGVSTGASVPRIATLKAAISSRSFHVETRLT